MKYKAIINPYSTNPIEVEARYASIGARGLTSIGYGSRIPTGYTLKHNGRTRRVYCRIYSNVGTLFIGPNLKNGLVVQIEEVA